MITINRNCFFRPLRTFNAISGHFAIGGFAGFCLTYIAKQNFDIELDPLTVTAVSLACSLTCCGLKLSELYMEMQNSNQRAINNQSLNQASDEESGPLLSASP